MQQAPHSYETMLQLCALSTSMHAPPPSASLLRLCRLILKFLWPPARLSCPNGGAAESRTRTSESWRIYLHRLPLINHTFHNKIFGAVVTLYS